VELEKGWQRRFNELALRHSEPHAMSHWTRHGFKIRVKYLSVEAAKRYRKGQRILDLGSGPGNCASWFEDQVLFDFSFNALNKIPATCRAAKVCGDFQSLPFFDKSFDGVVCVGLFQCHRLCMEHLRGLWRALKPGAWFLVETLNCEWHGLISDMDALQQRRYIEFLEADSEGVCYFVHNGCFVFYHPERLARWFGAAGFIVEGYSYLYTLNQTASLFRVPFNRVGYLNQKGKIFARSFYIYGRKSP